MPDPILLKLRRTYSRQEAIAYLMAQLSEAQIEVGKLKSEVCELSEGLESEKSRRIAAEQAFKSANAELAQHVSGLKADARISEIKAQLKRCQETRKEAGDKAREWRDKYIFILNKPQP
jgi:chromosome segregation ATPase